MKGLQILLFICAVVGLFVYIGMVVNDVSGGGVATASAEGVNPEAGEAIFFGKGKCYTCHSVGDQGSAVRGPNLGENEMFSVPIGIRAEERAAERSKATGKPYTPTDYIAESLAQPSAYVVDGFKNEMPFVYKAPIGLSADEIRAVITFLQAQGGEVDASIIKLPNVILAAQKEESEPWTPYIAGDSDEGEELFFDENSNAGCARCHTVGNRGGKIGPELTTVAGTRTAPYIVESVLIPNAEIASGYESTLVITNDELYITGIKKGEDDSSISLMQDSGKIIQIQKVDIKEISPQKTSIMPSGFADDLTMTEFHNLLAFVLTLDGKEKPEKKSGEETDDEEDEDDEEEEDEDEEENEEG